MKMSKSILRKFLENGFQVHPEALKLICSREDSERLAELVLKSLDPSVLVVQPEHVLPLISGVPQNNENGEARERPEEIRIIKNFTNPSSSATVENFHRYFLSRYEKLRKIIEQRGIRGRDIATLPRVQRGTEITLIGMINEIRETSSGNLMIELEDPTGITTAVVSRESECFDKARLLVRDEVIAVRALKHNDMFIITEIIEPDVRVQRLREAQKVNSAVLFLSDIHVGSKTFLRENWHKFVSWLNGEFGSEEQKKLSEFVDYIIVAGDIVDGIGVYPNQDKELEILNVFEQYEVAAEFFDGFPKRVRIIISPGNHDAVRQAEPQPPLPEEIQELFPKNTIFVSNPSLIEIHGLRILIYHGRSLDDIATLIPSSYKNPHLVMRELLKKRHLCPIYGEKVPLAPEDEDHMVIDTTPDVLHCGHVHTVGAGSYRGIFLINSGTWQDQTEFQKRMNIIPTPCTAVLMNLADLSPRILRFV